MSILYQLQGDYIYIDYVYVHVCILYIYIFRSLSLSPSLSLNSLRPRYQRTCTPCWLLTPRCPGVVGVTTRPLTSAFSKSSAVSTYLAISQKQKFGWYFHHGFLQETLSLCVNFLTSFPYFKGFPSWSRQPFNRFNGLTITFRHLQAFCAATRTGAGIAWRSISFSLGFACHPFTQQVRKKSRDLQTFRCRTVINFSVEAMWIAAFISKYHSLGTSHTFCRGGCWTQLAFCVDAAAKCWNFCHRHGAEKRHVTNKHMI